MFTQQNLGVEKVKKKQAEQSMIKLKMDHFKKNYYYYMFYYRRHIKSA